MKEPKKKSRLTKNMGKTVARVVAQKKLVRLRELRQFSGRTLCSPCLFSYFSEVGKKKK